MGIEEADAEVAETGAVDDGAAQDVAALLEGEAGRHAVVLDHAAVAFEQQYLLTVEPPDGGSVATCSEAHIVDLLVAVDVGDGPEERTVGLVTVFLGEAEELHVVVLAVECMPAELLIADLDDLSVLGQGGHLVLEPGLREGIAQIGIGEDDVRAHVLTDGLKKHPTADISLRVGLCG